MRTTILTLCLIVTGCLATPSCVSEGTTTEPIPVKAIASPATLDVAAAEVVPQSLLTTCPVPSALDTDLTAAAQAAVISLAGVNPTTCPEISMTETWGGGILIFSDSPESPSTHGKLYYDDTLAATSGSVYNRIFLYHVNGKASGKMKFTALIKNRGGSSGTLTVQKKGTAGPTTSYAYAGKLGFQRWLESTAASGVSVSSGSWARIDSTFDATKASSANLMHGIWDYSFAQPHTILICALDETEDPVTACPSLSLLTKDTHVRGTFPYADKVYDSASGVTIDTADDIQQFPLAGNTTNDANASGTDITDSSSQSLGGNYGILYKIHLTVGYSDGRNLGFLFNPRGGGWGGAVWAMAGLLTGGKFLIPAGSGTTSDNTKGSVEGKYSSAYGAPWLQFMPTGGSSFPLKMVVIPY